MNRLQVSFYSILLRRWFRNAKRRQGNFVVTGYPKSGTTWVTQMVSQLADLHYEPRKPRLLRKGVALHTHSVKFEGKNDLIYVVRDPREAVCSAARAARSKNITGVFAEDGSISCDFTKYAITELPGALLSMRNHLQVCIENGWTYVRFEDLKVNAISELENISNVFKFNKSSEFIDDVVSNFDFDVQRQRSKNKTFLAQSSLASWKTLLKSESLELLDHEVGEQALAFGYDLSHQVFDDDGEFDVTYR